MKVLKLTTFDNDVTFVDVSKIDAIALVHSLEFGDNILTIYANGKIVFQEKVELIKDLEIVDNQAPIYLIISEVKKAIVSNLKKYGQGQ